MDYVGDFVDWQEDDWTEFTKPPTSPRDRVLWPTCYCRVWWREADAVSGRPTSQLSTLARISALVSLRST